MTSENELEAYDWTMSDITFIFESSFSKIKQSSYLDKCELIAGQENLLFLNGLKYEDSKNGLLVFNLTKGEFSNSIASLPFNLKNIYIYNERLVVVHYKNQLLYIDPFTMTVEQARHGLHLPKSNKDTNLGFYESMKILNLTDEMATVYTDDGRVHFYLLKNTSLVLLDVELTKFIFDVSIANNKY